MLCRPQEESGWGGKGCEGGEGGLRNTGRELWEDLDGKTLRKIFETTGCSQAWIMRE